MFMICRNGYNLRWLTRQEPYSNYDFDVSNISDFYDVVIVTTQDDLPRKGWQKYD